MVNSNELSESIYINSHQELLNDHQEWNKSETKLSDNKIVSFDEVP